MSTEAMKQDVLNDIQAQFGDKVRWAKIDYGMPVVFIDPAAYHDLVGWLQAHDKWAFNHFIDITAVDYMKKYDDYRFEVVVHLRSHSNNLKVRIKTPVAGGNKPELPTLTDLFVGASWTEREVFDLMGITFKGHSRMTRLLNPDDFEGHPLQKDFPVKGQHRGSFPRGTVVSNKRREPVMAKVTKPKPADQILPRTPWEQQREPLREQASEPKREEKGDA